MLIPGVLGANYEGGGPWSRVRLPCIPRGCCDPITMFNTCACFMASLPTGVARLGGYHANGTVERPIITVPGGGACLGVGPIPTGQLGVQRSLFQEVLLAWGLVPYPRDCWASKDRCSRRRCAPRVDVIPMGWLGVQRSLFQGRVARMGVGAIATGRLGVQRLLF